MGANCGDAQGEEDSFCCGAPTWSTVGALSLRIALLCGALCSCGRVDDSNRSESGSPGGEAKPSKGSFPISCRAEPGYSIAWRQRSLLPQAFESTSFAVRVEGGALLGTRREVWDFPVDEPPRAIFEGAQTPLHVSPSGEMFSHSVELFDRTGALMDFQLPRAEPNETGVTLGFVQATFSDDGSHLLAGDGFSHFKDEQVHVWHVFSLQGDDLFDVSLADATVDFSPTAETALILSKKDGGGTVLRAVGQGGTLWELALPEVHLSEGWVGPVSDGGEVAWLEVGGELLMISGGKVEGRLSSVQGFFPALSPSGQYGALVDRADGGVSLITRQGLSGTWTADEGAILRGLSVTDDGIVLLAGEQAGKRQSFVRLLDASGQTLLDCEGGEKPASTAKWARFAADGSTLGILTEDALAVLTLEKQER